MSFESIPSRQAFSAFLELLKRVDEEFLSEERRVTEASDIAEGEHMLLHLVKAAIDVWVDNDASRPRFAPLASAVLKWGGEGADNPSHCAPRRPLRTRLASPVGSLFEGRGLRVEVKVNGEAWRGAGGEQSSTGMVRACSLEAAAAPRGEEGGSHRSGGSPPSL